MELGSGCVREEVEEDDQQAMMRSSSNSGGSSSNSKGKLPFLHGTTSASSFPISSFYNQKDHYYHPQVLIPLPSSNPTNQEEDFQDQEGEGGGGGGEGGGGGRGGGAGRESNTSTNNSEVVVIEKEHMFDKVVTPSDVGKLNRLVIPKQHAEKYFPLDSTTNEKGLLLNFEDRTGKPWRFRYSYWNSSQSYVMTKGWSRFVKEKKLDAGDIVSFQRGVGELARDRLYIDWRKRPNVPDPGSTVFSAPFHHQQYRFSNTYPWSGTTSYNNFRRSSTPAPILPRDYHLYWGNPTRNAAHNNAVASGGGGLYGYGGTASISPGGTFFYMRPAAPAAVGQVVKYEQQGSGSGGGVVEPVVYESVPVVQGKEAAAPKRLRLFGVNMECPITTCTDTDSNSGEENKLSSTASTTTTSTFPTLQRPPPSQIRFHNGSPIFTSTSVSNMALSSTQKGKPSSSSTSLDLDLSDNSEPH